LRYLGSPENNPSTVASCTTVVLALDDEHGIALIQAYRLSLRESQARTLEYVHDLLGVGVPVQQVDRAVGKLDGEQDDLVGSVDGEY
jgi:hypothetical protein